MISTAPFLFHLGLDSASSPISRRVVQPTTKPKGGQGSHPCLFKPLSLIGFFENIRNVYTNRSKNQLRSWALQSNCCTYNLTSLIYFNITPSGHSKYRANISCLVSWNLKYLWICDTISLILGKTLGSFQKIHGGRGICFASQKSLGGEPPGRKGQDFSSRIPPSNVSWTKHHSKSPAGPHPAQCEQLVFLDWGKYSSLVGHLVRRADKPRGRAGGVVWWIPSPPFQVMIHKGFIP